MRIGVILVAGGLSTRMGGRPKTLISLLDKPVLLYSLEFFQSLPSIEEIVVVADKNHHPLLPTHIRTAPPGARRQDSVYNGFLQLSSALDTLLIHDGARPLLATEDVLKLIAVGENHAAAALASPVRNCLKKVFPTSPHPLVAETRDRTDLWEVYTPQIVQRELFAKAYERAYQEGWEVVDDLSLLEKLGFPTTLVPVSLPNIKITFPEDILHVTSLLQIQAYARL